MSEVLKDEMKCNRRINVYDMNRQLKRNSEIKISWSLIVYQKRLFTWLGQNKKETSRTRLLRGYCSYCTMVIIRRNCPRRHCHRHFANQKIVRFFYSLLLHLENHWLIPDKIGLLSFLLSWCHSLSYCQLCCAFSWMNSFWAHRTTDAWNEKKIHHVKNVDTRLSWNHIKWRFSSAKRNLNYPCKGEMRI